MTCHTQGTRAEYLNIREKLREGVKKKLIIADMSGGGGHFYRCQKMVFSIRGGGGHKFTDMSATIRFFMPSLTFL